MASSIQAEDSNLYGQSKLAAEKVVKELSEKLAIQLLSLGYQVCLVNGVSHYNSVVATFCHNIARNIPVKVIRTQICDWYI